MVTIKYLLKVPDMTIYYLSIRVTAFFFLNKEENKNIFTSPNFFLVGPIHIVLTDKRCKTRLGELKTLNNIFERKKHRLITI